MQQTVREMNVQTVQLNKIKLGKNSRLNVTSDELAELMLSIKESGLLQPIGIMANENGYEVCYGNRRFLAASKLGWSKIPAVIIDKCTQNECDLNNLAENIQRRNIGLAEAGRYFVALTTNGLSKKEIAVKLGVALGYINAAIKSYQEVPEKFREDIVQQFESRKVEAGKIALKTAQTILSAKKSYGLKASQVEQLFEAAKNNDDFNYANVPQYAGLLKAGKKDFMSSVTKLRKIALRFNITEDHYFDLEKKYVTNGPFRSVAGAMIAALADKKNIKINVIGI